MNYIIALTGKSSAGKDFILSILEKQYEYKRVVSTTTRPIRSNETDGIDYHFVTNKKFDELIKNDELIEYRYYDTIQNGESTRWHYGIERKEIDLDKYKYVVVVDLQGLKDLQKKYGYKVISFYIDVDVNNRKMRAMARDKNFELAEWSRRTKDDDIKFNDAYMKTDFVVENYNLDKCIEDILNKTDFKLKEIEYFSQYSSY